MLGLGEFARVQGSVLGLWALVVGFGCGGEPRIFANRRESFWVVCWGFAGMEPRKRRKRRKWDLGWGLGLWGYPQISQIYTDLGLGSGLCIAQRGRGAEVFLGRLGFGGGTKYG